MRTRAQQNSVTDNKSNNERPMHLIQCTGIGPGGKDCVARTSLWLPKRIQRNSTGPPFLCAFRAASEFEECKKSPPSKKIDITSLYCADSNEQYGRRDTILNCGVAQKKDEDVFERKVQVANEIGETISAVT